MSKKPTKPTEQLDSNWIKQIAGLFKTAIDVTNTATRFPLKLAKTLVLTSEQLNLLPDDTVKLMRETGAYLHDMRKVAGITRHELAEALDLEDQSFMEAVEAGTATLSFELILRLAAVLARHDPIPFVLRFTRTYNPELWQLLVDWGIGSIPLQLGRERQFTNILRAKDDARDLSDEQFADLLRFTESAFELAFNFINEQNQAPTTSTSKKSTRKTPEN